jgi:hypothetical protein
MPDMGEASQKTASTQARTVGGFFSSAEASGHPRSRDGQPEFNLLALAARDFGPALPRR